MISFDFEYYKPSSVDEAVQTFKTIEKSGKSVIYYGGGTEFITFARTNKRKADAVIDIKGIPECNGMEMKEDKITIGSAVTLNTIAESDLFPLLGHTVKQIADHTSRNKITLGGNINSHLMYREGILPLLLTDAKVKVAGNNGEKILNLNDIYTTQIQLEPGQFLMQVSIEKDYANLPFVHLKKAKVSKVGYPIVAVAALVRENRINVALSGVCEYPFRFIHSEDILNNTSLSISERIDQVVANLPSSIVEDIEASAEYREFVLRNILQDTVEQLEGTK